MATTRIDNIARLSPEQRARLKDKVFGVAVAGRDDPIVSRADAGAPVVLSPAQRRLWILSSLDPDNTAYNLASMFRITGQLDQDALQRALNALERRHEILRTVYREDAAGETRQWVQPAGGVILHWRDLSGVEAASRERVIRAAVLQEANVRFDLCHGPVWRVVLIQVAPREAVLVINVHHIAFDGWSLGVLVRELFQTYRAARTPGLPAPLAFQYADYSVWRNQQLNKTLRAPQQEFWRRYLADAPAMLDLPYDRARPEQSTGAGAMQSLIVPRDLFTRLCELGKSEQATPFNVFMALFNVLLLRYTGQDDLVLGTPVSGRERDDTHGLIGVFANTLPLRTRIDPAASFRAAIRAAQAAALDAFAHADLPFDAIVEATRPPRVAGCNPIFQVMFAYQNKVDPVQLDDVFVIYEIFDPGTAKFDLSLDIFEGPEGPTCLFEYDTALFSHARIARLCTHFLRLAEVVLADPHLPVSRLDFLTDTERRLALAGATQIKHLPYTGSFMHVFDACADKHAQAIAVVDGEIRLSYAELRRNAERLAAGLARQGVTRGTVVGVCLPRGSALIETLLAILRCGAAFVALDPAHPPQRLLHVAQDAAVGVIVTDQINTGVLPGFSAPILTYESLRATRVSMVPPEACAQPQDLAYIVYTSGTTGLPKGCGVTHRNWLNALHGWETVYGLGSDVRRHLQMANLPFDVFCGDFIRALGSGGTLVICPQETLGDAAALYALMLREHIDCAEFVPAVFRTLADWLRENTRRLDFMRVLIVASDSWYRDEYAAYKTLIGTHTRLINSYGMAEATIDSTWFEQVGDATATDDGVASQLVPIGRAFPNVEVYVLDRHLQPLPPGIAGEICVAGWGVSRGYLNQPALNQQRFVPHPFSTEAGACLYRSGDIGRWRADGQLELLGRNDQQIKIRGQRIELAEIETALLRHPDVAQCAVLLCDLPHTGPSLVAYVVPGDHNAPPAPDTLTEHLRAWLPLYMLPGSFSLLAQLPLTANGKVDRKALPAPLAETQRSEHAYVAPRNLIEEMLTGIWCEVLALPRVGVHDSFFVLGGHSLLAFQVIARARKLFKVELPIHALFMHPSVAGLAQVIASLQGRDNSQSAVLHTLPLVIPDPARRYDPFPLTPVQQAYWLGRRDVFEFGNVTAHSYDEFETPALDPQRFERAWNRVIQQHDMLRAVVNPDGTQQVLPTVPHYAVQVVDLRTATPDRVEAGLLALRAEMSHQMLDVQSWPAFDVRVSLLPAGKVRAHFSTDAIMFDVWSFLLVLQDLIRFYLDPDLQPEPIALSFRDYVLAEQAMHSGARYQRALVYWRERVSTLPAAPQLPLARNPAQVKQPRFTRLHATLEPEYWDRLKRQATRVGLTPTGVLLAAYAEVLARFSRSPRFSLNLTFLNRHPVHPQVNEVVGEFTSLTLLAVDGAAGENFMARARKIQSDLWNDLEHHDIGGVQVLREIARSTGDPTRARMPVVFTSALVVPMPQREAAFPVTPVHRDGVTQTSQVWLDCGVWEEERRLLCNWDVVKEMYPPGFIEGMFECFSGFLRALAQDDGLWEQALLPLLPVPVERRPEPLPVTPEAGHDTTLVALFLRQLTQAPDRCAIETPTRRCSYRELALHAAGVAARLRAQGVARGELVAVAMHKGWEQAAATLGVMAAGAAYLPIDPDLPAARIDYLLQHGQVRQLLTQPWLQQRFASFPGVCLHAVDEQCQAGTDQLVSDTALSPDDLAYVIFTSGSTGMPKGVMIEHRGAVNTLLDLNKRFGVTSQDSVLAISALNFDLSVYDFFGLLAAGARVVLPEHERRLDPLHWAERIRTCGVTLWNTVPALMGLFVDHVEARGVRLPSLRQVLLSGDWIPVALPDRIRASAPQASITALGGATEASVWSILYDIGTVDADWSSIPYGQAMQHQGVYVLDSQLQSCPTWVAGDIYIGGVGLARGYWRDNEKTAAAFVVHARSGARLYRTGDLGRWRADGNIEFLGRADFQVKVQGHRIEPGEIEATLQRHAGIKDAVVVAAGDARGQKRLVGYLVPRENVVLEVEAVRDFLRSQLPEYMVPQVCLVLPRLPLSANGKVDRQALPPVGAGLQAERKTDYLAARNPLEEQLATLWCELLGLPRIGVFDNFFAAGGDSMTAIRLVTRVRCDLGRELTLAGLFAAPCIAALAEVLHPMPSDTNDRAATTITDL